MPCFAGSQSDADASYTWPVRKRTGSASCTETGCIFGFGGNYCVGRLRPTWRPVRSWSTFAPIGPTIAKATGCRSPCALKDEAGEPVLDAEIEAAAVAGGDALYTVPLRPDDSVPGRYVGAFEQLPSGAYRVEPRGDQIEQLLQAAGPAERNSAASFTVRNPLNRELLDTRSDQALARQLAEASGGQVLPPTAVSEVLALTDLKPIISEQTEKLPLWVQWKFLWMVFGCLFAEWVVRKRMGLS